MGRSRTKNIHFMVTDEEYEALKQRMESACISDMGHYLRTLALTGDIYSVNLKEFADTERLCRFMSKNLNQIAKRVNESGNLYAADIEELRERLNAVSDVFDTMRKALIL